MDVPEMVERVARVIRRSSTGSDDRWAECVDQAYAVIRAMHRPTEAMLKADAVTDVGYLDNIDGYLDFHGPDGVWRGMIDAALGRPPILREDWDRE